MLNYAYAVLESQIRIAVSAVGLDPTIRYLHANEGDRPALVLAETDDGTTRRRWYPLTAPLGVSSREALSA
jgi:hypothetical protein